jgi:hypothetical protein
VTFQQVKALGVRSILCVDPGWGKGLSRVSRRNESSNRSPLPLRPRNWANRRGWWRRRLRGRLSRSEGPSGWLTRFSGAAYGRSSVAQPLPRVAAALNFRRIAKSRQHLRLNWFCSGGLMPSCGCSPYCDCGYGRSGSSIARSTSAAGRSPAHHCAVYNLPDRELLPT